MFKSLGVKYAIDGKLPKNGPYIIMHNHSSFLDMFFLPIVLRGKYTGVIAAKNFKIPIINIALNKLKAIPIYRSNHKKAIEGIKIAEQRIREGFNIAIFPEGTRTITGRLSKLKKGGFHMAKNTNTKILPIIVKGLYEIKPKNRWTLNTNVSAQMIIEKPLDTINYSIVELIEKMNDLFEKHGLEVVK
jgi:1-acyl-sn-glycerol-3-phosphate acyltransferase